MSTIGTMILESTLDIILLCSARTRSKNSLRHYVRSTFLATYTTNSWRDWLSYSSTNANYYENDLMNSPKLLSSSIFLGIELLGFLTRSSPELFNKALIFYMDDSNYLLDATNRVLPSSNAYLVLANILS